MIGAGCPSTPAGHGGRRPGPTRWARCAARNSTTRQPDGDGAATPACRMPGTRLQRLRQRAMDANSRAARRTFPTAAREVRFQIRSVHPSSEDGVTGLDPEVVAVTRGRLAPTSYVDRSDQAMAEDTRHRGGPWDHRAGQ